MTTMDVKCEGVICDAPMSAVDGASAVKWRELEGRVTARALESEIAKDLSELEGML
jgi:hypothetical protein